MRLIMTENEFNTLKDFINKKLEEENSFAITTSRLFRLINYDIQFSSGHNKLYNEFLECCEKYNPTFSVKSVYKSEGKDKQFDILFTR